MLLARAAARAAPAFRVAARPLSTGSHSDFQPKLKTTSSTDDVTDLIKKQVSENKVMLYMKGTPASPMCGFSGQVVRILHATGGRPAARECTTERHLICAEPPSFV
jgi:monothiol glutaredoxin